MWKKFILWGVTFICAYLTNLCLSEYTLSSIFFWLHAGITVMLLLVLLVYFTFGGPDTVMKSANMLVSILRFGLVLLVLAGASYVATLLLSVSIYDAYMLMTFGQCLCHMHVIDKWGNPIGEFSFSRKKIETQYKEPEEYENPEKYGIPEKFESLEEFEIPEEYNAEVLMEDKEA